MCEWSLGKKDVTDQKLTFGFSTCGPLEQREYTYVEFYLLYLSISLCSISLGLKLGFVSVTSLMWCRSVSVRK